MTKLPSVWFTYATSAAGVLKLSSAGCAGCCPPGCCCPGGDDAATLAATLRWPIRAIKLSILLKSGSLTSSLSIPSIPAPSPAPPPLVPLAPSLLPLPPPGSAAGSGALFDGNRASTRRAASCLLKRARCVLPCPPTPLSALASLVLSFALRSTAESCLLICSRASLRIASCCPSFLSSSLLRSSTDAHRRRF
jgi:hypothetical protein